MEDVSATCQYQVVHNAAEKYPNLILVYLLPQVESEVQSNRNLFPDTGNNFVPNTSSMEEPQLLSNQNLGFGPRNNFADNYTSPVEVEPGLISNPNLVSDQKNPFIPIASSMVESELQSNHSLVSDTGNYFATNTSTMEEPQLLSNQNLGFDTRNYLFADNTSSMLLPHQIGFLMVRMNMLVVFSITYNCA
ncbi:uncharacterized protein LOC116136138 [Pistacia vera]|uniref:uncharacterized protein LOC116136138 n=1 Tax=Pistacia vera TaxID=55513 RepID=UPI001262C963|nr:uncharacterized protein LOC116136138 [Pistacia vera]